VSTTGYGEYLLRTMSAKRIADSVAKGVEPNAAIMEAMEYSTEKLGSNGGAVLLTVEGDVGAAFNSRGMGWAWAKGERLISGCLLGQRIEEKL